MDKRQLLFLETVSVKNKILNYGLQLNKNYLFLLIPMSSVIKFLMYLDSLTSSKLLPRSQTFSSVLTFRW